MHISQSVIQDLACAWIEFHGSAAAPHLELMIIQMRRAGDGDGVTNYARVLKAVRAKEAIALPQQPASAASPHRATDAVRLGMDALLDIKEGLTQRSGGLSCG